MPSGIGTASLVCGPLMGTTSSQSRPLESAHFQRFGFVLLFPVLDGGAWCWELGVSLRIT